MGIVTRDVIYDRTYVHMNVDRMYSTKKEVGRQNFPIVSQKLVVGVIFVFKISSG